jgi:hypothetical protein
VQVDSVLCIAHGPVLVGPVLVRALVVHGAWCFVMPCVWCALCFVLCALCFVLICNLYHYYVTAHLYLLFLKKIFVGVLLLLLYPARMPVSAPSGIGSLLQFLGFGLGHYGAVVAVPTATAGYR